MIKQYIIKYKVFTLPFYYEFISYAQSTQEALTQFIKSDSYIGIERFYISKVIDI